MIVRSLRLVGYKRLSLGGVRELIYRPENKIQLILGTNGSGKSSMLKELFPLPADLPSEFEENGLKEIVVDHRGSSYTLTNTKTNGSSKHSFIKDGQELNTTGKKSLQTHLVLEHFNIKPSLRDLLTGLVTFTGMSPAERKKFFISVSDIDYDAAMRTFNKVRKKKMDTKANIGMLSSRILSHKSKVISEEEKERLREKISYLNKLIEHYLVQKDNDGVVDVDKELLEKLKEEVVELSRRVEKAHSDIKANGEHIDADKLGENIHVVRAELNSSRKEYEEIMEGISSINAILEEGKGATAETLENLKKELSDIRNKIHELASSIEPSFSSPFTISGDIITEMDNLVRLLPEDNEPQLDSRVADEASEELMKVRNKLDMLVADENQILGRLETLEHARGCDDVQCPKCGHEWKPNFSPNELNTLETRLQVIRNAKAEFESEIRNLEAYLKRYNAFMDSIRIINYAAGENNQIKGVLQWLLGVDTAARTRSTVSERYFKLVNETLPALSEWKELVEKENVLKKEVDRVESYLQAERDGIADRLELMEKRASEVNARIGKLTSRLTSLEKSLHLLKHLKAQYRNLRTKLNALRTFEKNAVKQLRTETINSIIRLLRLELQDAETAFYEGTKAEPLIEEDTKQLAELEKEKSVLEDLEKALSPTEGVIADSIVTFINGYLAEMNRILEKVWEYPIELLPCDLEEGELSYKFPVRINNTHTTKDISQTSSSMKEIIDLAFKIVFMQVADMTDYPLYMDEFGKSMDEKHQSNAFKIIETLASSDFEQVFLISHYEHCYGRFSHADVNVMHEGNLSNVVNSGRLVLQ